MLSAGVFDGVGSMNVVPMREIWKDSYTFDTVEAVRASIETLLSVLAAQRHGSSLFPGCCNEVAELERRGYEVAFNLPPDLIPNQGQIARDLLDDYIDYVEKALAQANAKNSGPRVFRPNKIEDTIRHIEVSKRCLRRAQMMC